MSREIELAWAAGFFDGEGHTRWQKNASNRGTFCVSVSQLEKEPLERFKAAVGGGGHLYGPKRNGKSRRNGQPYIYAFSVNGLVAIDIYNKLKPHLCSVKKRQGDAALEKHIENAKLRRKLAINNTSGYSDIVFLKRTSMWVAQAHLNKKRHYIGSFADKEDAYKAQQAWLERSGK